MLESCTMTRRYENLASRIAGDKTSLLRPLPPVRNRTAEVIERITREIISGALAPGARLPTEQELVAAMGVSRTVVREAVAALKADGLVVTRQGSGAYVSSDSTRVPFRIDSVGLGAIDEVIAVMELRLAVEIEAAGLAAERASPAAIAAIELAHRAFVEAIEQGQAAITEDFNFHLAIAEATQNERFTEFLRFLGNHLIPRQSVRGAQRSKQEQKDYLSRIAVEHERIATAIRAQQPTASRQSMRAHLTTALGRYRRIARSKAENA